MELTNSPQPMSEAEILRFLFKKAELYNEKFSPGSIVTLSLDEKESFLDIKTASRFFVDIKRKSVYFFERFQKDTAISTAFLLCDTEMTKATYTALRK